MRKGKKILKFICYPHIAIVVCVATFAVFGLVYSLTFENAIPVLQYLSYILAGYALFLICCRIPNGVRKIKGLVGNNRLLSRYFGDLGYRVKISLFASATTNAVRTLFYMVMGIVNQSLWFYSLSVYYALLSVMRFFLLKDIRKEYQANVEKQWRRYLFCGVILVVVNLALGGIAFLVIQRNQGFSYHFVETIAIALFTFINTISAIVNSIKYRKYHQPIISAVKFVSLSSALVSMFALETAMLGAFGQETNPSFRLIMTSATGGAFGLVILAIAVFMIVKSSVELRKIKRGTPPAPCDEEEGE